MNDLPAPAKELVAYHTFDGINMENHALLASIFPDEYVVLTPESINDAYCDMRRVFLNVAYQKPGVTFRPRHHIILSGYRDLILTKDLEHPAMTFLRQYMTMLINLLKKQSVVIRLCVVDLEEYAEPNYVTALILHSSCSSVKVTKPIKCNTNSNIVKS